MASLSVRCAALGFSRKNLFEGKTHIRAEGVRKRVFGKATDLDTVAV